MRKTLVSLLLLCLTASMLVASQARKRKPLPPVDISFSGYPVTKGDVPPHRSSFLLPPGTVLDSSYYDAQRNGSLGKRIWMNEDGSIHATYMKSPDSGFADRSMIYYYADAFGGPFFSSGPIASFRNGYGNVSSYPVDTPGVGAIAVVSTHDSQLVTAYAFPDAFQGLGAFSQMGTNGADQVIWPKPMVNSDGSITLVGTLMNDLNVNGITHNVAWDHAPDIATGFTQTWTFLGQDPARWSQANMEYPSVGSGENGRVGIVIADFAIDVHFYESTDNGVSFAETLITNAAEDTIGLPSGPDSTTAIFLPWQSTDIVYVGEEPHVVWSALQGAENPTNGIYDLRSRILHWSPSTGIDTVAISRYNSTWVQDSSYVNPGARFASIDWPQIGRSEDGSILYCVFTMFDANDVDETTTVGFGDAWGTYSLDNGVTWADAINITNPDGTVLGADDRYPSLPPVVYDAAIDPGKDAYIVYQTDDTGGSFLEGEEPANMDLFMFLGVDFDIPSGIDDGKDKTSDLPKTFALHQNYPNPFNPSTTVRFEVPEGAGEIRISIYDSRGRLVNTLFTGTMEPGEHQLTWNGEDTHGARAASGIYFLRLKYGTSSSTIKMVMVK